ncbi:MAG: carbamoyl-phosphate synthase small subunit [Alphaproteobacteria bacterium]|nr:carbamoyl-phosphate synthase small subunit [Alphaproteobacteria bacterium]
MFSGKIPLPDAKLAADVAPQGQTTAVLVLADGSAFRGVGIGAAGTTTGEVCFNTAMTGYQEILTDPSYAGQIIAFTFPHIGNVGANDEDNETTTPVTRGLVLRAAPTEPSNYRALAHLNTWLVRRNLIGIAGVDCRRLTRLIRDGGPQTGTLHHSIAGVGLDHAALAAEARAWPGLEGMDLARVVSCSQTYAWTETSWRYGSGYGQQTSPTHHVVAVDFGAKHNILRSLAATGARVTVVPAQSTAADVLRHKPDGVFLSNGPGDPAATGRYAVPMIRDVIAAGVPLFGICLGFQMLGLALGAKTKKMFRGHRGANHPVKEVASGKVAITSQNHGFMIDPATLPAGVTATHESLFDHSLEGLAVEGKPVFGVQYHPEASPGPHDAQDHFATFAAMIAKRSA